MENNFYYTFSTIAQVLAGFLALSGVFVLYQIQRLNNIQLLNIKSFVDRQIDSIAAQDFFIYFNSLTMSIESGDINNGIFTLLALKEESIKRSNTEMIYITTLTHKNVATLEYTKDILIKLTKISLIIGVSSILYSLLVLANVSQIVYNGNNTFWYFTAGITSSIMCLSLMSFAIILSLHKKPNNINMFKKLVKDTL